MSEKNIASPNTILEFQHVTKRFPGVTALDDVSLSIQQGEIHGICGENGAGKSTLIKILSGVYPYGTYDGQIFFEGEKLVLGASSIRQAAEKGIAVVYQELTLVPTMTVGQNVYLGREPVDGMGINWDKLYANTQMILSKYNMDIPAFEPIQRLGVGKMQMVEIAKALSENAKILILDEPTSALNEAEVTKLMGILETLKSHGITCIYITHKLEELFRITDVVTVMRDGKLISTSPIKTLTLDLLVRHMVGREMKERFPKRTPKIGDVIMEVEDLEATDPNESARKVIDGVSFNVRRGEILGIAGLMGSGRTELVTTLFGEYGVIQKGKITVAGREIRPKNARQAIDAGIGLVPEDRKGTGLVLIQSVLKNISLPNLNQFSKWLRIDDGAEWSASTQQAKSLSIKTPSLQVAVETLSGGNQQKVVISKWLLSHPNILIMDDPTRGIDVGAKYEIYRLMNSLAEQGVAIIMISSDLEEILGMSDRIMVMCRGRSAGTLPIAEANEDRVMALATGITK